MNEEIRKKIDDLNLIEEFQAEGKSYVYLDDEGNIVKMSPPYEKPEIIKNLGL